jgi:ATP adenylyltransferase
MDHIWTPWRMSYIQNLSESNDSCVFCDKKDADDQAEYILRRRKSCYACLNVFPYTSGHLLVVPFKHVSTIEDLPPECLLEIMSLCQEALAVLRIGYQPHGFNVGLNLGAAAGAGMPDHVHLHVVPRWVGDSTFMSVLSSTRILPELLQDGWQRLRDIWDKEFPVD